MKEELIEMGFSIMNVHNRGTLWRNTDRTIFITVHEDEVLAYTLEDYRPGFSKCGWKYRKFKRTDLQGLKKKIEEVNNLNKSK